MLGLFALTLPLLASLQFYTGYSLRLLTAEASRWPLMAGRKVERSGTTCARVQMVWLGYFAASAVSLYLMHNNRIFLTRLPVVNTQLLVGNILHNTLLRVTAETLGSHLPDWAHEAGAWWRWCAGRLSR